jgi:hypothetical protein
VPLIDLTKVQSPRLKINDPGDLAIKTTHRAEQK